MSRNRFFSAAFIVAILSAGSVRGQTWTGAISGSWNAAGNWSPAAVPTSNTGTKLIFGSATATAMTNDIGPFTLNQMTFNAGDSAYTLTGNTLFFQAANGGAGQPTFVMNSNTAVTIGDAISYASALTVQGTGTGTVALNGPVAGGLGPLNYQGTGALVLGGANTYNGGTVVTSGTLLLANAAALPAGGGVTVGTGATLNTGGYSNTAATAIGALNVNGGTIRIPTGTSDFYVNQLAMAGGSVDATASTSFALHFVNSGAGITVNAGTTTWIGAAARFQNDSGGPVTVTLNGSPTLNIGLSLTGGAFSFPGSANVRLSNTGNTANITASGTDLYSNDLSTNVGAGAFGTLGTGTVTLTSAVLTYDGPTASSAKPLTINTTGYMSVANAGVNLTLNGAITESAAGSNLSASGPNVAANPSTLTLAGTNTYSGTTAVSGQLIVAIPTFAGLGTSSTAPANLQLGGSFLGRGTLLYTGAEAVQSTNRGATVFGQYTNGDGGAIGVQNAGTNLTWNGQLTGSGSFIKTGAGTLTLTNTANNFTGGTYVVGGTLSIGASGAVLPAGSNVTVQSGGALNLLGYSNSSAAALGTVTLNSGTLAVSTGVGDYYLNQLTMTNGAVDVTGSTDYHLHFINANAGITINTGTSNWIGSGTSRIQNDTANPLTINVAGTLNAGMILSGAGTNPNFTFGNFGTVRLSNTGNTANITVGAVNLFTNDMSTDVGHGRFGTLGTGTITLANIDGQLLYDGPSAVSDKPLTIAGGGVLIVNPGTQLTMNGLISEIGGAQTLYLNGNSPTTLSTVTLTANNTFSGGVNVSGGLILAVASIGTAGAGGTASLLGAASNAPANLVLGATLLGRGSLLYTGVSDSSSDRGATVDGLYANKDGGSIGVQNAATTLTWNGSVIGAGSFIKSGPGTLMLTNTSNTYTGGTYVEAGTLALSSIGVIPVGTDVTVLPGAQMKVGTAFNTAAAALGTFTVNGGTLNFTSDTVVYFKSLVLTGGTVVGTPGLYASVNLTGATTIVTNASAVTSTITLPDINDPYFAISGLSSGPAVIQVAGGTTPSGVDLDLFAPLGYYLGSAQTFIKTGSGVLRLNDPTSNVDLQVSQGKLRVDTLGALGSGALSLTGGTFQYGGPTDTLTKTITLDLGTSVIEVMQSTSVLTLTNPLSGGGGLTIRGPGTLVLPAGSTYSGGTTIDGTTYAAATDSVFGASSGPMAIINGGLLQYTTSTASSRVFNLDNGATLQVAAGQTLTLTGARVNGGFLRGPGAFAVTGGTVLTGATTSASTVVSVTGPASFTNFSNGGPITIAAGLTSPTNLTVFSNQGSGSITLGAASVINAVDFQTYGLLTINPATSPAFTQLTNMGTSPLYFNGGSRTFIGTPATASTFVAGIDLRGQNAFVAGGLFVNNGYVVDSTNSSAVVVADYGALVKGAGFFQNSPVTQNGGRVQAGNSPGSASFGQLTFGPGGVSNYVFAIDDATGTAGPSPNAAGQVSGWGLMKAVQRNLPAVIDGGLNTTSGNFTWTANATDKLTFAIETLVNPTTVGTDVTGLMADFDPSLPYSWPAVSWTGTYSGPTDVAALDASTIFDTTSFENAIAGTFGWSFDSAGQTLSLTYTPSTVPEPGTLAFAGAAAAIGWWHQRRRFFADSPRQRHLPRLP